MAESWISVVVKRGSSTILPRKIVKIGWDSNFGELLAAVDPTLANDTINKVCISGKDSFWIQFMNWMLQLHCHYKYSSENSLMRSSTHVVQHFLQSCSAFYCSTEHWVQQPNGGKFQVGVISASVLLLWGHRGVLSTMMQ